MLRFSKRYARAEHPGSWHHLYLLWVLAVPLCAFGQNPWFGEAGFYSAANTAGYPVAHAGALNSQDGTGTAGVAPAPGSVPVTPEAQASINGTVRDGRGAAVPGVRLTLTREDNSLERVVTSDTSGTFAFTGLAAGSYRVKIAVPPGFESAASADVVLTAGERHDLPVVAVRMPVTSTTVNVTATVAQVAEAQVHEQEKQRVMGILPNYYSSFIWDAAPMTPKLKTKLALRSITDPYSFLVAAALAGGEQWHNTFPGYGQGSEGYAKRYGAAYADMATSRLVSRALLPSLLHQDPRYFYHGSGSVRSRMWYAVESAFICRGDNGRTEPNYSQMIGNFAGAGISNLYRSPGDRSAGLTFRNGLFITGTGVVENLLREFFSRKLTSNVPAFANGKP